MHCEAAQHNSAQALTSSEPPKCAPPLAHSPEFPSSRARVQGSEGGLRLLPNITQLGNDKAGTKPGAFGAPRTDASPPRYIASLMFNSYKFLSNFSKKKKLFISITTLTVAKPSTKRVTINATEMTDSVWRRDSQGACAHLGMGPPKRS